MVDRWLSSKAVVVSSSSSLLVDEWCWNMVLENGVEVVEGRLCNSLVIGGKVEKDVWP